VSLAVSLCSPCEVIFVKKGDRIMATCKYTRMLFRFIWQRFKMYDHLLRHYLYAGRKADQDVITAFHKLYWNAGMHGGTWRNTRWMGVEVWKCPLDLWIYQEIIHEVRPDLIIETGTNMGGSALYMAHVLDAMGKGRVLTIDVADYPGMPKHERIEYFKGSSIDTETIGYVRGQVKSEGTVMVVLDSLHHKDHVLREMELYAEFVTPGSFLIVEDTDLNGHPIGEPGHPGPKEAIDEFMLRKNCRFDVDATRHKFFMTQNQGGFLRRKH